MPNPLPEDLERILEQIFETFGKEADGGYAALMNKVIDSLLKLTVWSAGYADHETARDKTAFILAAKREVANMQGYAI